MVNQFKKYSIEDCAEQRLYLQAEINRLERILSKLSVTQSKNPNWTAYDKYTEEDIGIDIRIEEQRAALEEQENNLRLIKEQEDNLYKAKCKIEKPSVKQISLF